MAGGRGEIMTDQSILKVYEFCYDIDISGLPLREITRICRRLYENGKTFELKRYTNVPRPRLAQIQALQPVKEESHENN